MLERNEIVDRTKPIGKLLLFPEPVQPLMPQTYMGQEPPRKGRTGIGSLFGGDRDKNRRNHSNNDGAEKRLLKSIFEESQQTKGVARFFHYIIDMVRNRR